MSAAEDAAQMPEETFGGRFHFFYALRCLRYGFLLCLIPLVRALATLRLDDFLVALQQDALILALMGFLSVYTWMAARWRLEGDTLTLSLGFAVQRTYSYRTCDFAACELRRSLGMRLFGAAELELYLSACRSRKSHTLLLTRRQAEALCGRLFPVQTPDVQYRPSGGEWLTLVTLSTNLVTETALVLYTVHRVQSFLGADFGQAALSQLERVLLTVNSALPTGLLLMMTLFFFFTFCSLLISALRMGGYRVGRAGGTLLCRGGVYTRIEQRVRLDRVNCIDVRRTLFSRLVGWDSVYLFAGGFSNRNTPVFFYRRKDPSAASALLPGLVPARRLPRFAQRSPWQFFWPELTALAVLGVFWLPARRVLPGFAAVLGVLWLVSLGLLAMQIEAFFTEGWAPVDRDRVFFAFSRLFTRHFATVDVRGCAFGVTHTSLSVQQDRATLRLRTPAGRTIRARGIRESDADRWVRSRLAGRER